jgi:hypothetical protein
MGHNRQSKILTGESVRGKSGWEEFYRQKNLERRCLCSLLGPGSVTVKPFILQVYAGVACIGASRTEKVYKIDVACTRTAR